MWLEFWGDERADPEGLVGWGFGMRRYPSPPWYSLPRNGLSCRNCILSYTVFDILRVICRKSQMFPTPRAFGAAVGGIFVGTLNFIRIFDFRKLSCSVNCVMMFSILNRKPAWDGRRTGFCINGAQFGKYVGALPCLNTVTQLPDRLRTRSCHHRHVSIPVLPPAGKSLVYFKTFL